ncbi:unnamed protein product [Prunus armeniaca]|uniref:Uncharacterized protein n=1 Tax=Prunus armeniaca TaxID=36596 RepID=A0A6J5TLG4_PRUAR|nr:unnamed protein product [Prunus armeniaca]
MWFARKPSLNHLKIWGCLAYVKKHDIDKILLLPSKRTKGVYCACVQKVELKEESREPHEPEVEFDPVDDPVSLSILTQPPDRSKKINKTPNRYLGIHHALLMGNDMEDPETYTNAMLDIDSKKW